MHVSLACAASFSMCLCPEPVVATERGAGHSHGNQQVDEHDQHQHSIDGQHEDCQAAGYCVD